ncbi:hypothetical protein SKAU_G00028030 [Synaphobranchus kaupii]|uniref:Uncharacterized protein n=1 Tax=Synaphobranchus kaupii TaxID=118154 RepID=A0A9Q1GD77_SYNKA|nr:hypothetical protein SKAU_G00028030 [Synaphobranchus kaupii]
MDPGSNQKELEAEARLTAVARRPLNGHGLNKALAAKSASPVCHAGPKRNSGGPVSPVWQQSRQPLQQGPGRAACSLDVTLLYHRSLRPSVNKPPHPEN